ncbi:MAG TPA: hypothetical protein VKJ45_17200 [Blastocatellia bacterium]|nr:hypothetical protein [Blastocatellia bacterium]
MGSELVAKINAAARRRQMQGGRHGEAISTGDGAARRYAAPRPAALTSVLVVFQEDIV